MIILEQTFRILTGKDELLLLPKIIERAARICYKSEQKITEDSSSAYILCQKLINASHEAMLEHGNISVKLITDRGVSHEIVRHRMASYAQESTRYVKYTSNMEFIRPVFPWAKDENNFKYILWASSLCYAELNYGRLLAQGCSPQEARTVLPNSLKTEIIVTANVRSWRNMFYLRTAKGAHPQIRHLFRSLLIEFQKRVPILFDDITLEDL